MVQEIGAEKIEWRAVAELVPYARNARIQSDEQVAVLAASIGRFGFNNPILVDAAGGIIAGHGRVLAAKRLGMSTVPVVALAHLSLDEKRAYILADNKTAELSEWDEGLLKAELLELESLDMDFEALGFSDKELETLLPGEPSEGSAKKKGRAKGADAKNQFAVMVLCESEEEQESAYTELAAAGWHCKVVTV